MGSGRRQGATRDDPDGFVAIDWGGFIAAWVFVGALIALLMWLSGIGA